MINGARALLSGVCLIRSAPATPTGGHHHSKSAERAAAAAANAAELAAAASQQGSSSHGWLECSICLQDLREASAEERLALPCAHVFHAACVEPWLRTHSECPECKTPVR